jgi:hypothetical protein
MRSIDIYYETSGQTGIDTFRISRAINSRWRYNELIRYLVHVLNKNHIRDDTCVAWDMRGFHLPEDFELRLWT